MPSKTTLAAILAVIAAATASPLTDSSSAACKVQKNVQQTFYGYPDNSPPGASIAYTQCGRSEAGGTGTYDDPLTMATASGELKVCEIVYAPYLKKYLRYEDECAQCETDWQSGEWHVDTWTGSSTQNGGQKQINCEDDLTPDAGQAIIRNPSKDLPVDTTALFSNGKCQTSHTYPSYSTSTYCS
ncbi:hypothetical protein VTN77DRAFT_6035 [Rasamsonia byssochlamydoides]|uniref:uncharacterized protein n=1 Tax=Rasamsonia byssochlamydoides TaxID=89139 RepID=UPI003744869C